MLLFNDHALCRRLELAEGQAGADFVEANAIAFPDRGSEWMRVGNVYVLFDGTTSPITQTFGLGLEPVGASDLDPIEAFYDERRSPVAHEVSPLADPALLPLLQGRGYRVSEFTSVMWRPIHRDERLTPGNDARVAARPVQPDEHAVWASVAARGWSELHPELREFMHELAQVNPHRRRFVAFLSLKDDEPIAAGGLSLCDGVALLGGAATVPHARRQGAQRSLLEARLRYAAERGCDLAMMCALPGSASQRNAERQGFRVAYTRVKWERRPASGAPGRT